MKVVTEEQIYEIETEKAFGDYIVKRANIIELEVTHNGVIVFKGEDFEVADYINDRR